MSTIIQYTPLDVLDQALEEAERADNEVRLTQVETLWIINYIKKTLRNNSRLGSLEKMLADCQTKHKCTHNPDCTFSDEL